MSSTLKLQNLSFMNSTLFSQTDKTKCSLFSNRTAKVNGEKKSGVVVREAVLKGHRSLPVTAKMPVLGKS